MDLQEWRQKQQEGEAMTLPSGLEVRVKRVGLLDLAAQGNVPAPLLGMVEKVLDNQTHKLVMADFPQYAALINSVVLVAVVSPPIADRADATHLAVDELPMGDRLALFNWANEVSTKLEPFRQEPGKSTSI